jgi:hypothetical protein
MPTLFTNAVRMTAAAHKAVVAAYALINTLPVWTYWMLIRNDGTAPNTLLSKGSASAGVWISQSIDSRVSTRVQRDGSAGSWVPWDAAFAPDNEWRWLVISHDVATGIMTQRYGPMGGTLTTGFSGTGGGSGALSSDAAFPLTIGGTASLNGGVNTEWAFLAVSASVPSDAIAAAVVADPLAYGGFLGGWKPGPSHTTSVPNLVIADPVLPPLVLTGATIVAGPDEIPPDPPVFSGLVIHSNPNGTITSFPTPLLPVVVRKIDQYGAPFLGTPPATCSVSEITLPYSVTGTLEVDYAGSDATFDDWTAVAEPTPAPAPPTLTLGTATDAPSTRTQPVSVASSGAAWPSGTMTQLQTRRGSAAFANQGAAIAASGNLTFARESTSYTVDIRGISSAPGTLTSAPSAVVTVTVPALATTPWATPSFTLGTPVTTGDTRTYPITAAAASGALVQAQTRRGSSNFADTGATFSPTSALAFPRESSDYSVDIRIFATGEPNLNSTPSAVQTVVIPALVLAARLAAPSLVVEEFVDTLTEREAFVAVSGPVSWPGDVEVQLQTQRGSGAWTDAVRTVNGATLTFDREEADYPMRVRGIAEGDGDPSDSEPSGVLTLMVPAIVPPTLGTPSIAIEPQPEAVTTKAAIVRVTGPGPWPPAARAQLYARRVPSATWIATGDPLVTDAGTLTYAREVDNYTIEVSAIAVAPDGSALPSARSAPASFVVPGLDSVGLPLAARIRLSPSGSEAGYNVAKEAAALVLHTDGAPNVLLVDRTTDAETKQAVTLSAVLWRLEDRATRRVLSNGACTLVGTTWRSVVRHAGGSGMVLVVELVPLTGARTRMRYSTSWKSR